MRNLDGFIFFDLWKLILINQLAIKLVKNDGKTFHNLSHNFVVCFMNFFHISISVFRGFQIIFITQLSIIGNNVNIAIFAITTTWCEALVFFIQVSVFARVCDFAGNSCPSRCVTPFHTAILLKWTKVEENFRKR